MSFVSLINEQDIEDFEQEQLIKKWLEENSLEDEFEFNSMTRKGTVKHVGDVGAFSLDQVISNDGDSSFHEIISVEEDEEEDDVDPRENLRAYLEEIIAPLNLQKDTEKWLMANCKIGLIEN